jgi:hypothetical protein
MQATGATPRRPQGMLLLHRQRRQQRPPRTEDTRTRVEATTARAPLLATTPTRDELAAAQRAGCAVAMHEDEAALLLHAPCVFSGIRSAVQVPVSWRAWARRRL